MNDIKIAINGFGRIGRSFFRAAHGLPEFDIVAVNDLADAETLAYLLKYDSVYGRYHRKVGSAADAIVVDGKSIRVFAEKDPINLPWRDLGVDIVVESTGFFTDGATAKAHLNAGAKRVVITAPGHGDGVVTALVGVNDDRFGGKNPITCNASCTTNSVAPVMAILLENFGVGKSSMVTVHSYTGSQKLVDTPSKDIRESRAAAHNIIPTITGSARAVIQAIPELEGKFVASAVRVPTIAGSLSVMTALLERETNKEELNMIFKKAAADSRWSKVIKTTEDPIVSTDIIGEPYGAIIDLSLTGVMGGNFVQVYSWYDNEAGYTATLIEHIRRVSNNLDKQ